jgi:uncharacterized OsmC-like protein
LTVNDRKPTPRPTRCPDGLGDLDGLKDLYDRKARVMANRPELARSTGHVHVRLHEGLACAVEGAHAEQALGLASGDAGASDHRSPEQLLRASLAASLALGYRLWSARLEIAVAGIEVELHTDDDARGQLLLETDVAPGWQRVQIVVTILSDAAANDVQRLIDCANRHCLVLATLSREIEQVHQLRVLPTGRAPLPPVAPRAAP